MTTSAVRRVRRHNVRDLLVASRTLAGEAVHITTGRETNDRGREELKRALCIIAERLAIAGLDLESMLTAVRVGDHRGQWMLECAQSRSPRTDAPTQRATPTPVGSLLRAKSKPEHAG